MGNKLLRYIELLLKLYQSVIDKSSLSKEESEEFNRLCREIFEELIRNPGGIIYIGAKGKKDAYKFAIERLFEIYSGEKIWDEILSGGYGGIVFDELDKYAERAKELIPTFINIEPSNREFHVLYNEAMKCWFYGLENSAVILSSTLLENTLKSKDGKRNKDKDSRNTNLYNLINKFESVGVLSTIGAEKAHEIRDVRNKIVHQGMNIASSEALRLVRNTKDILEEIFS
ncbi:MAG: DUF4145 domain-containing protein [Desulfobacterales bacterium]|nr:DUF4145 domain-containing protein [Desulfobacterales bacterium]